MPEELDTLTPPDLGQEPEPTPEPVTLTEPESEPEPEPISLTPEQIIEQASERAFQRMASWQGRRDKELFDNFGNLLDTRLRDITPTPSPPLSNSTSPTVFEDSDAWARAVVPRILNEEVSKRTHAEQTFNTELIRRSAGIMDADPLFTDKVLGNEVVEEIQKNFGLIDRQLSPAIAAQLLVNSAITNVIRKRTMAKINPLAGNKPITGPMGTIVPSRSTPLKAKPIKLTDEAKKLKEKFGYSEEDIQRVFGEG